jgi:isovaleryl-CoA dehydrogenase
MVTAIGRLGNHEEEYGKVVVGPFMYARGEELMHWQEMMAQPRNAVTRWHQLSHCQKQGEL